MTRGYKLYPRAIPSVDALTFFSQINTIKEDINVASRNVIVDVQVELVIFLGNGDVAATIARNELIPPVIRQARLEVVSLIVTDEVGTV